MLTEHFQVEQYGSEIKKNISRTGLQFWNKRYLLDSRSENEQTNE